MLEPVTFFSLFLKVGTMAWNRMKTSQNVAPVFIHAFPKSILVGNVSVLTCRLAADSIAFAYTRHGTRSQDFSFASRRSRWRIALISFFCRKGETAHSLTWCASCPQRFTYIGRLLFCLQIGPFWDAPDPRLRLLDIETCDQIRLHRHRLSVPVLSVFVLLFARDKKALTLFVPLSTQPIHSYFFRLRRFRIRPPHPECWHGFMQNKNPPTFVDAPSTGPKRAKKPSTVLYWTFYDLFPSVTLLSLLFIFVAKLETDFWHSFTLPANVDLERCMRDPFFALFHRIRSCRPLSASCHLSLSLSLSLCINVLHLKRLNYTPLQFKSTREMAAKVTDVDLFGPERKGRKANKNKSSSRRGLQRLSLWWVVDLMRRMVCGVPCFASPFKPILLSSRLHWFPLCSSLPPAVLQRLRLRITSCQSTTLRLSGRHPTGQFCSLARFRPRGRLSSRPLVLSLLLFFFASSHCFHLLRGTERCLRRRPRPRACPTRRF